MAGFMKNAMSYLGMSDVVDDEDDYIEEDEEQKPASKSAFDSDHTVTPLASTTAPAASSTTKPFPGGRVNRITTIHPKSYEDAQLVGRALRDGCSGRTESHRCGRSRGISHRWNFSAGVVFGVRGFPRACHSARVPVEPGAGEHQGRRADKTSLGTRFVR